LRPEGGRWERRCGGSGAAEGAKRPIRATWSLSCADEPRQRQPRKRKDFHYRRGFYLGLVFVVLNCAVDRRLGNGFIDADYAALRYLKQIAEILSRRPIPDKED
jgi:hypothetical protein